MADLLFWIAYVVIIISLIIVAMFAYLPFFFGAPWEPTSKEILKKMVEYSKPKKGEKIVDLGSGSGTIVIEFAKNPSIREAHGYEINPILVWISRRRIKRLGLEKKAFIHFGNFMNHDLSKFDIVAIFQIFLIMGKIEKKLKKELKKGSRVVSNAWKFKDWKPSKKFEESFLRNVYLYKI